MASIRQLASESVFAKADYAVQLAELLDRKHTKEADLSANMAHAADAIRAYLQNDQNHEAAAHWEDSDLECEHWDRCYRETMALEVERCSSRKDHKLEEGTCHAASV